MTMYVGVTLICNGKNCNLSLKAEYVKHEDVVNLHNGNLVEMVSMEGWYLSDDGKISYCMECKKGKI